jgi:predicted O-methyltransferase YrrM/glycosyltransferase involved in cell wall biosynthesis
MAVLSTIILNWNRDYLLKRAVESYYSTVGEDSELIIVDNASTDGSVDYIRSLDGARPIKPLLLDQNLGGEAYNLALPLASGNLIHLSENDQVLLQGWFDHVLESFRVFPDLGQLSLFSDTPTDDEAWEPKSAHLRFAAGKILYQAHGTVGASSVLRAQLFRERGIRVQNLEHGAFRFPADAKLSEDVKAAGFWVAWSDRYYVRNVGHEIEEFEANPAYYQENYASKPWVGVDEWKGRIDRQKSLPRLKRFSTALPQNIAIPEKTMHSVDGKAARLWSMFDGFTAEVEVLDFIYALTRLVKPRHVLETGTWLGWTSCAIARALSENGFGHLTTFEINKDARETAVRNIESAGLSSAVTSLLQSSMEFTPDGELDMALFDSDLALRVAEFERFRPWFSKGALVIFHDTAPHHGVVLAGVNELIAQGKLAGINLPTPRGVFIGKATRQTKSPGVALAEALRAVRCVVRRRGR